MKLQEAIESIVDIDFNAIRQTKENFSHIAKPLNGLGLLEEYFIKISGIQRTSNIDISKKAVVIMCADNGVVCQGVTQTTQDVTAIVAKQIALKNTIVCKMAELYSVDVIPVDIGIAEELNYSNIIQKKIGYGTNDISKGSAMTREQAILSIEVGINLVGYLKDKGYKMIATGEMGIGNTTTSSACAAVLLDRTVEDVTGRGAGLSTQGLLNKIEVIKKAISINSPNKNDAIDILSKLGGFDIGGMIGLFIGGAVFGIPIVVDGFISGISAILATMLSNKCVDYMLPSHCSKEPASHFIFEKLKLEPILFAQMALGEGTGAVSVMPLYDMINNIYYNMLKFSDMNIDEYKPLK